MASKITSQGRTTTESWQEISSFVVEFAVRRSDGNIGRSYRTIIHHVESAETADWSGLATIEAAQWMEERLVKTIPVRRDFLSKGIETETFNICLTIEGVGGLACDKLSKEDVQRSQYLGLFVEKSPLSLKVVVQIPKSPSSESSPTLVPVGIYIQSHSRAGGKLVSLVAFETEIEMNGDSEREYQFDGIYISAGFHQLYTTAVLYHDRPLVASTSAQLIRVV